MDSYKNQTNNLIHSLIAQQDQLWQSGVIIKSLLSAMNVMFYVKNTNQKYVTANEAFLNIFGLPAKFRVLNTDDCSFFSHQDAVRNTREDAEVLNTGIPISDIESYIPGSKKKRWGVISKSPILDSLGNIVGIVGMFIDITRQKNTENELIIYKKALDSASDAICMCTPHGVYFYQNIAYEKLFGTCSYIEQNNNTEFGSSQFIDCKEEKIVSDTILSGNSWTGEIKMMNRYKMISDILLRAYPIKDINNKTIGFVRVHTDISDQKKHEKERRIERRIERRRYRKQLVTMVNKRTAELLELNRKLKSEQVTRYQEEQEIQQQTLTLCSQKKRLNCFFELSNIIENSHSVQGLCIKIVNLIPRSWNYSEVTCSRITINDKMYSSDFFSLSKWKMTENIQIDGKVVGSIEVYILENKPLLFNNAPFLQEEVKLLKAISVHISQAIRNLRQTRD